MAKLIPLKIAPFTNPNGAISYRVSGTLAGGRVRQNFKTEIAARAFLNSKVTTTAQTPKPVITHLREDVVRQAETAAARLPAGTDLVQAVDFFALHHRTVTPLLAANAVTAFGEWLRTQRKNEQVTTDSREGMLTEFFTRTRVDRSDRITVAAAEVWIYADGHAARTQRDRFDLLNYFCGWLVKKSHAAVNPVAALDRPVAKPKVPRIHTFAQVQGLLQSALTDAEGPDMLPYFAICALSAVREGEAKRIAGWNDIHLGAEHRFIEVNKAKGGRSRRNAPISEPLGRILAWCKARELSPIFFSKRKFDRIRRRAGLFDTWEKDVLRHTYASAEYTKHKDIKRLADAMGNSERVLFQHYLRPMPLIEARRFDGLILHYTAPREKSRMGTGPKPRRPKANRRPGEGAAAGRSSVRRPAGTV